MPVDGWKCDMVGTASQKGFMIPPGLSFISMSPDAWAAQKQSTMPKFYFDLEAAKEYLSIGQTPWTPNLSALYGLNLALDQMLSEGIENIFARHTQIGDFTRQGAKDLGLELLCQDSARCSDTVTAIKVPSGIDGAKLTTLMRKEHDVVLAGGQGKLSGQIFRIGHLGAVDESDIQEVFTALEKVLPEVGFRA